MYVRCSASWIFIRLLSSEPEVWVSRVSNCLAGGTKPHKFRDPTFWKVFFLVLYVFVHHCPSRLCNQQQPYNDVKSERKSTSRKWRRKDVNIRRPHLRIWQCLSSQMKTQFADIRGQLQPAVRVQKRGPCVSDGRVSRCSSFFSVYLDLARLQRACTRVCRRSSVHVPGTMVTHRVTTTNGRRGKGTAAAAAERAAAGDVVETATT